MCRKSGAESDVLIHMRDFGICCDARALELANSNGLSLRYGLKRGRWFGKDFP